MRELVYSLNLSQKYFKYNNLTRLKSITNINKTLKHILDLRQRYYEKECALYSWNRTTKINIRVTGNPSFHWPVLQKVLVFTAMIK
jgi:hypothetical protein